MILSIPSSEALRCGLAPWFVQLAKESILDPVCSSTALFLKIRADRRSNEALCVEFMNVLCAVSHCGHTPEELQLMFASCLEAIQNVSGNLGPFNRFGCSSLRLCQILSMLAKSKNFWGARGIQSGKRYGYLSDLLKNAFKGHKLVLEDSFGYSVDVLERICDGRHLHFYPRQGLTVMEQQPIREFQAKMFDFAAPRVGFSLRWSRGSVWNATLLESFLNAKYIDWWGREHFVERREQWIEEWLIGIVEALREESIPVYSGGYGPKQ